MKFPSIIVTILLLCFIFFFFGFLSFSKFYDIVLPNIYGLQYEMDLAEVEDLQNWFAVVIGSVPVFVFITWELIPLRSLDKKIFSAFIVLICMLTAVYIRYKMLLHYFEGLVQSLINKTSVNAVKYPFSQLGFEYYLSGGLITGSIISYLIFHNVVKRKELYFRDSISD
jgi:hypothetical protein